MRILRWFIGACHPSVFWLFRHMGWRAAYRYVRFGWVFGWKTADDAGDAWLAAQMRRMGMR